MIEMPKFSRLCEPSGDYRGPDIPGCVPVGNCSEAKTEDEARDRYADFYRFIKRDELTAIAWDFKGYRTFVVYAPERHAGRVRAVSQVMSLMLASLEHDHEPIVQSSLRVLMDVAQGKESND